MEVQLGLELVRLVKVVDFVMVAEEMRKEKEERV